MDMWDEKTFILFQWLPGGEHRANIWTGTFPSDNTEADGWRGTGPVTEFPASKFGHKNMIGNVWEWTAGFTENFGLHRVNLSTEDTSSRTPKLSADFYTRIVRENGFVENQNMC